MIRRLLPFVGGALPTFVCAALALPAFAQDFLPPQVTGSGVADGGTDDGGLTDGGDVDGGALPEPVVVAPSPAQPAPPVKPTIEPGADIDTGVKGHVYDAKTKQPMAIAPVIVKGGGKTRTAITDEQGGYRLFLPPGTYSVMSYYDLYHGARIKGARVTRGKLLNLNLMLFPLDENEEVSIQEFEIAYRADTTSAAAQDQLRLASSNIGEGFGAKQMSQVGASDAGGAASRVVGVQVQDNQLVVRGLGGRYTRVLLNGVPVPSTDPDLPGADLDLFPTHVIDSLNISKTFLPNTAADFAGGLMEIKSVTFPRKFTLEVGLTSGYRTQATFRQALTYKGGSYDYLSFDDGRRSLPDEVPKNRQLATSTGLSGAEVDAIGRNFRNVWSYNRTTALPPLGVSLNIGNSHRFGKGHRFGYVASASYEYELFRKTGLSRPRPTINSDGTLAPTSDFKLESGSEEVSINGFLSASLDVGPDHSFTALTLANRSLTDEATLRQGQNLNLGTYVEDWQLEFLSRSLVFNQLLGDHRNLGGTRLRLRWGLFQSSGARHSPDRRLMVYSEQQGRLEWVSRAGSGERLYSDLTQNDIGANLSLRFPLWPEAWGTIGGWAQQVDRDFLTRRFRASRLQPDVEKPFDPDAYTAPGEVIFGPTGLGSLSRISEITLPNDSYKAGQSLLAAFAMLETPVIGRLSFAGGMRLEAFTQSLMVNNPFVMSVGADPVKETERTDVNYLPGANLKYSLSDTMNLRAAYGVTVSRPSAREIAPFLFFDFLRDRTIEGDPNLKTAVIQNSDVRWEWFFAEGQVLAFSAFYKSFENPIELVILNPDYQSQFKNGKEATNFGGESELRLNLGRITPALKYIDFDGNLSLIRSRVELQQQDSGATVGTRRLAGQAPYLLNLSLRFNRPDTRVNASIVYNVVGPRISDVGIRAADIIMPNVEEQPFHSLDFIGGWRLGEHLRAKLKVRNILFQNIRMKQGNLEIQRIRPGLSALLSLSYEY